MNTVILDIVIVTYNRLNKLKHALACYDKQSELINKIIVVNNNSNDGTDAFLSKWENEHVNCKKHIINLQQNIGGAGGFSVGQKYALEDGADWVFVADDDAYISDGMLNTFYDYVGKMNERLSAICATVCNMDSSIACEHRSYIDIGRWNYKIKHSLIDDYDKDSFCIDLFSYVGTFLNVKAMREYGICNGSLFIYADDTEHSMRMKQYGKIICVPCMKIFHDSGEKIQKVTTRMSWRDYYAVRNRVLLLKKYSTLAAIHYSISAIHGGFCKKKIDCIRLIITAVMNAWLGREGIHPVYKPGFDIK